MKRGQLLSLVALGLLSAGCGQGGCQQGASAPAEEQAPADAKFTGTVRGTIRLAEGASLPRYGGDEFGREVAKRAEPGCAPLLPADGENVKLGATRGLEGVMIAATGDSKTFFEHLPEHVPVERSLLIEDCRLNPRLVVGMRGDTLVIKNQSSKALFPLFGQATHADSLAQGETRVVPLEQGGVTAVTCPIPPDCGRADVIVVMNPVFTLSGDEGSFVLEGVPADQDVQIHAWHPLFQEAKATTRVSAGGEATVELVLEPRPVR